MGTLLTIKVKKRNKVLITYEENLISEFKLNSNILFNSKQTFLSYYYEL